MIERFYDYMIVGQGLAGSILSYLLMKEGKSVLVYDEFNANSSSQVAAGLVNPITGRRIVKTWMADTLLPFADNFYKNIQNEFGEKYYSNVNVLEILYSVKEINDWTSRISDPEIKKYFIKESPESIYINKIRDFKKMIRINSAGWLNIPLFINSFRNFLQEKDLLIENTVEYLNLIINTESVAIENIKSKRIIFCDGYKSMLNPLWNWLPFIPAKGEILLIECKDMPEDFILLSGIFLIPVGENKFRVGSTYEWNFSDELPSEQGKMKLVTQLNSLLKLPYDILEHRAGIRPTVKDRRPFIGCHPQYENVFIFNGLGTKGVQLAPYFADHFVKHLEHDGELINEVNVNRFTNIKDH